MTLVLSSQIESLLIEKANREGVSPEAYAEILLRRFLSPADEATPETLRTADSENRPRFGSAKGMVTLADDFDEPLEDLREYMY